MNCDTQSAKEMLEEGLVSKDVAERCFTSVAAAVTD